MKKLIFGLLVATCLTPPSLFAGTEEFQAELKEIRTGFAPKIRALNDQDSGSIFMLTEELSKRYKGLATKICEETMQRHPEIKDLVSVALCGSVAWGEPTLKSDIEVIYLVPNHDNMEKIFNFALDFADEVEKIGDTHFKLDQVSTAEFNKNKLSILECPPAIFTKEDIENFTFKKNNIETTTKYLEYFSNAIPDNELKEIILDNSYELSTKLSADVSFSHSLFNVEHLFGNIDLFRSYDQHFQSLVEGIVRTFADGKIKAEEDSQKYAFKIKYYGPSSEVADRFQNFLNNVYTRESFDEDMAKMTWRCNSNVIRSLGYFFGKTHEKGSLNTLNALKNDKLQGTKGSWNYALSELSYNDLLDRSTRLTWTRLMSSVLEESEPQLKEIMETKFYDIEDIANISNTYYKKYYGFLHGIDDSI